MSCERRQRPGPHAVPFSGQNRETDRRTLDEIILEVADAESISAFVLSKTINSGMAVIV